MRRMRIHPASVLSILAALAIACTETAVPETLPDGPGLISFNAFAEDLSETKAILDGDNFSTDGNCITVYDKLTVSGNPDHDMYIDGRTAEYHPLIEDGAVTQWNFPDGNGGYRKYWWTKHGTHSFTVFTSRYTDGDTVHNLDGHLDSATYDEDTEELTVTGTLDLDRQFDFCYAHHSRNLDDVNDLNPKRPVALDMKHLFAAVQFNIMNLVPDRQPAVTELTISDIYRKGTAAISKPAGTTGSTAAVSYDLSSNGNIRADITSDNILTPSVLKNLLAGIGTIGSDGCLLVWPHTNDQLNGATATVEISSPADSYNFSLVTANVTRWDAGNKYIYNIYIQDNYISFSVKVVDWKTDEIILEE